MLNAYKLIYSTETTTLMDKIATNQAELYYLTTINCLCIGFVYSQCSGVT